MSMSLFKIYSKIALLSPRIEVLLRQMYWYNHNLVSRYNPNTVSASIFPVTDIHTVDFDAILERLEGWGVRKGSLLIVHSSYDSLKATGLSPLEIINKLRGLIGEEGTLAMPVIRHYKNEPSPIEKLKRDFVYPECVYNPKRTPVVSGLLPTFLMRMPDAEISLHPLNPLCAIGPLAKDMMRHNIEGDIPSPHGIYSAWHFCVSHNAFVCSLGTDLRHHNTIGHVAEEAFGNWYWGDDDWYSVRNFRIEIERNNTIDLKVKERKAKWGMLHQAELNRYKDLLDNRIIKSQRLDNVLVEFEESSKLINYLMSKNSRGYPYFK